MSDTTWVLGDLHLGHQALLTGFNGVTRPKGWEHIIFKAWDACVRPNDTVILLGDVAVGGVKYWFERLSGLPGHKVLVMGNRERNRPQWYTRFGFERVVPFNSALLRQAPAKYSHLGDVMFTHVPAFPTVLRPEYDMRYSGLSRKFERIFSATSPILNIHGHTHGAGNEDHRTFDAGVDVVGYAPRKLEQIMEVQFGS